jgi:hypothetical protein
MKFGTLQLASQASSLELACGMLPGSGHYLCVVVSPGIAGQVTEAMSKQSDWVSSTTEKMKESIPLAGMLLSCWGGEGSGNRFALYHSQALGSSMQGVGNSKGVGIESMLPVPPIPLHPCSPSGGVWTWVKYRLGGSSCSSPDGRGGIEGSQEVAPPPYLFILKAASKGARGAGWIRSVFPCCCTLRVASMDMGE